MIRNRYRIVRRLGAGAMGTVYEVEDARQDNARLALKALWTGPRTRELVATLKAEFGVLAAVKHPLLCRVYDFGRLPDSDAEVLRGAGSDTPQAGPRDAPDTRREIGGYFLTRELIEGRDLTDAARLCERDVGEICALLAWAARGLDVLHRAGMRHGDFKPANAIVDRTGVVRLIDFGLAVSETTRRTGGTLAYMAPELTARRAVDRRADLYALGVTLFELVTGELPTRGMSVGQIAAWHAAGARPQVRDYRAEVPDAVDRVLSRLWAPAPDDRLPTAAEAAAAIEACAESLGTSPSARWTDLVIAPLDRPHVDELETHFKRRQAGRGGSALVEVIGGAGSGRSAVLTEFAWRVELIGGEVFRGSPGGDPLGAFGAALDQVAALTGMDLAPITSPPGDRIGETFAAIARWLARAAARWPMVIVLDDVDYADATSLALARFLAFTLPASAPVLIVAARLTYTPDPERSERTGPDVSAARVIPSVDIGPLTVAETELLTGRAAQRQAPELAGRIYRHTGGNLAHVRHVLATLAERGFPPAESLDAMSLPHQIEHPLTVQLTQVESDTRALIEALAVLGRPTGRALVAAILGVSERDAASAADRARGLIAADPAGRWTLARPALGSLVIRNLGADRRRALHAAAASALTARDPAPEAPDSGEPAREAPENARHQVRAAPEIAWHHVCAGDVEHICARVEPACRSLARAGDHAAAMQLGRAALDVCECGPGLRLLVGEQARLVANAAVAEAAVSPLLDLEDPDAREPPTPQQRDAARLILGRVADESGHTERAETLLSAVIADGVDQTAIAAAARELSRHYIKRGKNHDALAVAQRALTGGVDPAVESHLLAAQAFARAMLGGEHADSQRAEAELDRIAARAGDRGDHALSATAFNYSGLLGFRRGDYPAAQSRYERALRAAQQAGDILRCATLRSNLGGLAFHIGDYARCYEHQRAATLLLGAVGADTPGVVARRNLGHLLVEMGAYEQARVELRAAAEMTAQLDMTHHQAGINARFGIVDWRLGSYASGERALRLACEHFERLGDVRGLVDTLLDLAEVALDRRPDADLAGADRALDTAASHEVTTQDRGRRARFLALRADLDARMGRQAAARTGLASLSELVAQISEDAGRHLEWSLHRSAALAQRALGDHAAAAASRRRALEILDAIAADLGDAHRATFWLDPRRRALRVEPARSHGSAIGPRSTLAPDAVGLRRPAEPDLLADRLYRLLDIYRRISSEREFDRLLELAMDNAVELSGAERGFLLLADDQGGLRTAITRNLPADTRSALERADSQADGEGRGDDAAGVPYSRTIAEQVFRTGDVVLSNAARADPRFHSAQSVHALHLERVVCIPVHAHGRIAGVLYLESRVSTQPIHDAELKLLRAFGDQVAILLDNARLWAENADRTRRLEAAQAEVEALLAERTELLAARTEELARTRRDLASIRRKFLGDRGAFGLIGRSASMERVFHLIERLAGTDVPVLVLGESGTGKELVARALHEYGPRKHAPMLSVNCGALPEPLLEGELFGHERGAFTGADRRRRGLFESASGGTLFLDEVGEMPARMQATVLRALQDGLIRRVGGIEDISVDVRIVAATNRDLEALVAAGTFRKDLFYRLHVVPVHIPPLRERADDIPLLTDHFVTAICDRMGVAKKIVSKRALARLCEHPWPGNVRQLEHALTSAVVMAEGEALDVAAFDEVLGQRQPHQVPGTSGGVPGTSGEVPGTSGGVPGTSGEVVPGTSGEVVPGTSGGEARQLIGPEDRRERERARILDALESCGWNKSKAARILQIPRRTFYRRLAAYGIR